MFISLKYRPRSSKLSETDHFAVVSLFLQSCRAELPWWNPEPWWGGQLSPTAVPHYSIQINFICILPFTIRIVSRCCTETETQSLNLRVSPEELPLISRPEQDQAGPLHYTQKHMKLKYDTTWSKLTIFSFSKKWRH